MWMNVEENDAINAIFVAWENPGHLEKQWFEKEQRTDDMNRIRFHGQGGQLKRPRASAFFLEWFEMMRLVMDNRYHSCIHRSWGLRLRVKVMQGHLRCSYSFQFEWHCRYAA